jgi:hypothetical protein
MCLDSVDPKTTIEECRGLKQVRKCGDGVYQPDIFYSNVTFIVGEWLDDPIDSHHSISVDGGGRYPAGIHIWLDANKEELRKDMYSGRCVVEMEFENVVATGTQKLNGFLRGKEDFFHVAVARRVRVVREVCEVKS